MTLEPPAPIDFDTLSRTAIGHAQAASGNIWTDYNIHDPGVTLLEQTCYALTEVSFQATHTTPDLLTNAKGAIRFDELSLFLPAETLPGDPVTLLDLAAELAEVVGAARVLISRGPQVGLLDAVIIPAPGAPGTDAKTITRQVLEDVTRAFRARRPLGCDLNNLHVAERAPAQLSGIVEITGTAIPERVAAEIYYHISAILRGQAVGTEIAAGATRQTVYDHPQTYLHAPSDQDGKVPNLENHLTDLRAIPGVSDITDMSLARQKPTSPQAEETAGVHYLDLTVPEISSDIDLVLTLNGVPLTLDANQILEEFVRVSADHIAKAQHHLEAADWAPPSPGQRRSFETAPVDALLPNVYQAEARKSPEAQLLERYRAAINAHLKDMSVTLRDLPSFLTRSTRENTADPAVQRERVALLDFLIAHQGEEMPKTLHAGLHTYRTAAERGSFGIRWRLDFLDALPRLNRGRGAGPEGGKPGTFLEKFRLLADLKRGNGEGLARAGQDISPSGADGSAGVAPDFPRSELKLPANPFDMLIPRSISADPLSIDALREASPWISDASCPSDLFVRAASPSCFVVSEKADGTFGVFFDGGHATHLFTCAAFETHADAATFTQRLRASWKRQHMFAEGAYLVEDILLRTAGVDFAPNTATLVLTGWTARTTQPTYRSYVEGLIHALSPAHLLIEPLWLEHQEMVQFEDLHRQYLAGDVEAKRSLRAFLSDRKLSR
ncbi:hypothetical protein [uncultured Roseobacter sp.]|uniref:hypothetical protein n=1 Tax=uncultured Roseobacter sp. TaxID=114847 RepID=UPI00262432E6|nr:hypothetical protein [uncultured Roseobacter sp.]